MFCPVSCLSQFKELQTLGAVEKTNHPRIWMFVQHFGISRRIPPGIESIVQLFAFRFPPLKPNIHWSVPSIKRGGQPSPATFHDSLRKNAKQNLHGHFEGIQTWPLLVRMDHRNVHDFPMKSSIQWIFQPCLVFRESSTGLS